MYVYTYTRMYLCKYKHIHIHVCVCVCVCARARACVRVCVCECVWQDSCKDTAYNETLLRLVAALIVVVLYICPHCDPRSPHSSCPTCLPAWLLLHVSSIATPVHASSYLCPRTYCAICTSTYVVAPRTYIGVGMRTHICS
jgi:hypothetical protein